MKNLRVGNTVKVKESILKQASDVELKHFKDMLQGKKLVIRTITHCPYADTGDGPCNECPGYINDQCFGRRVIRARKNLFILEQVNGNVFGKKVKI